MDLCGGKSGRRGLEDPNKMIVAGFLINAHLIAFGIRIIRFPSLAWRPRSGPDALQLRMTLHAPTKNSEPEHVAGIREEKMDKRKNALHRELKSEWSKRNN
jgi:hypothetical protein